MCPLLNWAQVIPNYSKSDFIKSYVETSRVFYTIPDAGTLEYLSNMEKMNIRSEKTVQKVSVYKSDHGVIREIAYQKPPSLPGWMTTPQKVILSDEGVWSFDQEGKMIAFTENHINSEGVEQNPELELLNYKIRNFMPLEKASLQDLSIPNTVIEEVKAGVYSIKNENSETVWDTKDLVIHTESKDQQGKLTVERSRFFAKTNKGTIYPVKEMAKYYLHTRNGQKPYYRNEYIEYSGYQMVEKGGIRSARQSSWEEFMAPDLINTIVQKEITIGGANKTEGLFRVKILDMRGRVILERQYDQPARRLTIDLGNIQPGIYACIMMSDDQTVTKKFIVK